ncbi:MAG TPA: hypothetical protein VKA68_14615 [bacterium]|nr:hypothetical protein [bacterium]
MKKLRIYADTSVFGGCFDEEFSEISTQFFQEVSAGKYSLIVSDTTLTELDEAPEFVQNVFGRLSDEDFEFVYYNEEVKNLRDAYIDAGILTQIWQNDAEHIAQASVADVDVLVSWNFKHIVNFQKIKRFQAINLLHGYRQIQIYSPWEVIEL